MSQLSDIRAAAALKPAFGEHCNGCGLCCLLEPCRLAADFLGAGSAGPCPALEKEEGRYWCGLLRAPHRHIEGISEKPWADGPIREILLASGAFGVGCDSDGIPPDELTAAGQ